jgi:hypothetical protein
MLLDIWYKTGITFICSFNANTRLGLTVISEVK